MAKFLTPPEWYDQNGNLNNMLNCASGENSVSLMAHDDNHGTNGVAIGQYSGSYGDKNVAIGYATFIEGGSNTVAIGAGNISGSNNVFVGENSGVVGGGTTDNPIENSIAIGYNATVEGGTSENPTQNSIAIGSGATVGASYQIQIGNNTANYSAIGFGSYKPYLLQPIGSFFQKNVGIGGAPLPITNDIINNADIVECDIEYNGTRKIITAYKAQDALTDTKVSTGMYLESPSSFVRFWFGWHSQNGWELGSQSFTFSAASAPAVTIFQLDDAEISGLTLRCMCYKIIQDTAVR